MLINSVASCRLVYMDYTHEQYTVPLIVYHLICCPRRHKVLQGKVAKRFKQLGYEVVAANEWEVIELALQPDVHLFLRANPYPLLVDSAWLIKGRSSHVLREEFPPLIRMPSLWKRSTFSSTAGHVSAASIQQSIERQSST